MGRRVWVCIGDVWEEGYGYDVWRKYVGGRQGAAAPPSPQRQTPPCNKQLAHQIQYSTQDILTTEIYCITD